MYVDRSVGGSLAKLGYLQNLYLTCRDNKSDPPGCHHLFIGVKP